MGCPFSRTRETTVLAPSADVPTTCHSPGGCLLFLITDQHRPDHTGFGGRGNPEGWDLCLVGVPAYHGMQGESLVPILDDKDARVRDSIVIEEDELFDMAGVGEHLRMRTLVTEDTRLSFYHGSDQGERFDLANDPAELSNVLAEPAARERRAELTEQLSRRVMAYAARAPKPTFFA